MKDQLLIIQNITREGPGYFRTLLEEYRVPYRIIDLSAGEAFPPPQNYRALLVLGGPDSANDSSEKILTELSRIREALDASVPYLGICLGLQLLVKAAGGEVVKCPAKEIGFRDPENRFFRVELTAAGKRDALFSGVSDPLPVFHLHGETVEPTGEMQVLGSGKFCPNQVIKVGANAYGIQGHFELTAEMLDRWLEEDADLQQTNREQIRTDFASLQPEYRETGRRIFLNFLELAGLV